MNKFGVVLGIAAVATLAGCKDPDYKRGGTTASQNEVKNVETAAPVAIEPTAPKCKCMPGTKHSAPCACGAPDCKCVVETKPVVVADVSKPVEAKKPAEAEYTIYIVQRGDYLAKISKKFNVTIASIKRLNPSIKKDVVRVGQKIKLPGKIDVGTQIAPVAASAAVAKKTTVKKATAKKAWVPYTGATKEYVVKNGDTLGSVAYGNGINIRQLKELNGLSSDSLKIGQKLKIPAEKVVKDEKSVKTQVEKKVEPAKVAEKKAEPVVTSVAEKDVASAATVEKNPAEPAPTVEKTSESAPVAAAESAKAATTTYVVQEGDDMTGVSIRWGVPAAQIRELNNLAEGDQLVPGQIIKLPADAQQ